MKNGQSNHTLCSPVDPYDKYSLDVHVLPAIAPNASTGDPEPLDHVCSTPQPGPPVIVDISEPRYQTHDRQPPD